ncbi:MAG: hypothetical protein V3W41_14400 [Planctomycetota bacterium]
MPRTVIDVTPVDTWIDLGAGHQVVSILKQGAGVLRLNNTNTEPAATDGAIVIGQGRADDQWGNTSPTDTVYVMATGLGWEVTTDPA